MELATIATMMKRIPRLVLPELGFVVMLAVTFAMVPPESAQSDVVTPRESTPLPRFFNHPELAQSSTSSPIVNLWNMCYNTNR